MAAWENWFKACEIGWSAPLVVSMRLAGIAAAGANPDARDRAENFRMGHEKLLAFNESWMGIGMRLQRMQIDFALNCWRAALESWSRPDWTVLPATSLRMPDFSPVMRAALDPVHRRVTGNVRRLTARKP
ncbi:hypothetical protein [Derxia gummosa]|uniref:Uncharacterized protein n=1 Tax=Derxia gummosa DSM 723 TaxID=1121388 RepID=A0A8B6X935_9BURK|nr:hypothetical protein [Derxia gummosa]